MSDHEEICEVEKIIGKRIGYGEIQYQIKWKDYGPKHNSWEPIGNLQCQKNIDEYEAEHTDGDDSLKWVPKPVKIITAQLIDDKMEYYVRFANSQRHMVTHAFGPMKKLIAAYDKEMAQQNPADDDAAMDAKKPTRKVAGSKGKRNETLVKKIKTEIDVDTSEAKDTTANTTATDSSICLLKHGIKRIMNMRRFDGQANFLFECKVCDKIAWHPVHIVREHHPQKVIDFYEACIRWKDPESA